MSTSSAADAASARIGTTCYWDAQDRLMKATHHASSPTSVTNTFSWEYDYRTRRIGLSNSHGVLATAAGVATDQPAVTAGHEAFIFSGGLSVAEHHRGATTTALLATPTVTYVRGPDMGGGVGGMLYSQGGTASASPKYMISNGRGDIVAQSSAATAFTWTASYETAGKRAKTTGTNADRQRGNSKEEDTRLGLLNEGFRYRDTETMVWLSRDPAGFVDGPNLYAYVKQNPWTAFDPDGLWLKEMLPLSVQSYMNQPSSSANAAVMAFNAVDGAIDSGLRTVGTYSAIREAGGTKAQAGVAAGVYGLGSLTGALPVAEAIDGNRIVSSDGGGVRTERMTVGERALQGTVGVAQMGLSFAGASGGLNFGKSGTASAPIKGASTTVAETEVVATKSAPIIKCFPRGTKVETPIGQVCIEDIRQGDLVLSQNSEGRVVARDVVQLVRNQTAHWVEIQVDGETIKATGALLFWEASKGVWLHARDLRSGMSLMTANGMICQIEAVGKVDLAAPEDTFSFEVAELHNYFAGTEKLTILTHNTDPWEIAFSRGPSLISASDVFDHGPLKGTTLGQAVSEAQTLGRLPNGLSLEGNWVNDLSHR